MLNISWKKKLTNERVENRRLLYTIQRRKMEHFGHVMRHNELLRVIVEGKVEGTKAKRRQRKLYLDDICTWTWQSEKEEHVIIRKHKDVENTT